jgi:hypothetical protein
MGAACLLSYQASNLNYRSDDVTRPSSTDHLASTLMACALVSPCGRIELLRDASLDVKDILQVTVLLGFTVTSP